MPKTPGKRLVSPFFHASINNYGVSDVSLTIGVYARYHFVGIRARVTIEIQGFQGYIISLTLLKTVDCVLTMGWFFCIVIDGDNITVCFALGTIKNLVTGNIRFRVPVPGQCYIGRVCLHIKRK